MLSEFTVQSSAPHQPLTIKFNWPGRHNVLNALAAIAIATELDVSDEAIINGLYQISRGGSDVFKCWVKNNLNKGSAIVVDDYGHHPQEIISTIDAFRQVWPDKRLVHVFQPHRYSRTQSLFTQFVDAL